MLGSYEITYYNEDMLLGGHFLEGWQLKFVKDLADFYFRAFNLKKLNVRMGIIFPTYLVSESESLEVEII